MAPSPRRLSEEIRALAAVRPATPLTAINPAFVALDDGTLSGALSNSRCSRVLLSKTRIGVVSV